MDNEWERLMDQDVSAAVAEAPAAEAVEAATQIPAGIAPSDADAFIALKNLEEKRKKKRRARNIKIAVVAGIAIAALGLWALQGTLSSEEEEVDLGPETALVERMDFSTSISAQGALKPASSVVVYPEVDGTVSEVMVSEGQHVEEGDVLLTLRSSEIDKAVSEAAEGVDAASDEVSAAKRTVNALQKAYKKAKKEYKAQLAKANKATKKAEATGEKARAKAVDKVMATLADDATKAQKKALQAEAEEAGQEAYEKAYATVEIPEVDPFDETSYVTEIESAKSEVTTAQRALSAARDAYAEAAAEYDNCTVRAPQAGTLLTFGAEPGMAIGEDGADTSSGSIARIADLSQLKVSVEVNEIDISSIEVGQRAIATFSAFPDLELEAKVTDIASMASGAEDGDYGGGVVSFNVDLVINKPDSRLKPGMTTSVEILTQDVPNALVIPVSALTEDEDGKTAVEVVVDEETMETELRRVKVGPQSASDAVIKKGLEEGDLVVVSGPMMDDGDDEGSFEDYEE